MSNNIEEDKRYVHKVLNKMKIDDEDKFMSAVSNVMFENNKKIKEYEDIIDKTEDKLNSKI